MRIAISFVIAACCSTIILQMGCLRISPKSSALPPLENREDFQWPEGKRAAISLTFDDARHTQITNGIPLLNEYGVKATFYVSPGRLTGLAGSQPAVQGAEALDTLAAWRAAVANGHEIGNHTLNHPCSGNFSFIHEDRALENYTLERMRDEFLESNAAIKSMLGVTPVSFAYPCGQKYVGRGTSLRSYVPLVAEHFLSGRGWMDEWANDPAYCDTAQLMGMELDGKSFEQVKQIIDRTLADGGWLVFAGHEIAEEGRQTTRMATLRALCEYAQDPANGIWLDTVEAVTHHIRKQRAGSS